MVTFLALAAAVMYGVGDFVGGAASRRAGALTVLLVSIPLGLGCTAVVAGLAGGTPTGAGLAWGFASGLASGIGFLAFYRALAMGPMSVVAPVEAMVGTVVPVAVGLGLGERPEARVLAGVALCVGAIGFVSREPGGGRVRWRITEGPGLALLAGLGFGVFFVLLHQAGDGAGLWPLVSSRAGVLLVVLLAILAARGKTTNPRAALRVKGTFALVVAAAVIDVGANVAYFRASTAGLLTVVAVLTSLYPAVTVLLARVVHGERLRAAQRFGLGMALTGVALVTLG
ncbi:EamA family transporter [Actinocorallia sp. A-T 12471]|uniref:EamA family transporter n=1 Tax=Actinocorallia sp. A-T 12471 TaxID=3089813 RepID=UPI0029CB17FB|nr:EamA family transporter [Actinocorallia sp. A-T 12471]MDX6739068.1 EamA family transporter [Actinocorallia sp. A-T 12471]